MTPLVENQGIIVIVHKFYSSRCIIFDIFVEQLCYPQYILPTHEKYHKLFIRDVANMMGKRSVGWGWWSVHPHGQYHHMVRTTECMM